jgi:hypothetical protein
MGGKHLLYHIGCRAFRFPRSFSSCSYPLRRPQQPTVPGLPPNRVKLPLHGGTLTISIVEDTDKKAARPPMARMLAELQRRSKLGDMRPTDEVESLQFDVKWEPMKGVLAANIDADEAIAAVQELVVVRQCSCARMLLKLFTRFFCTGF